MELNETRLGAASLFLYGAATMGLVHSMMYSALILLLAAIALHTYTATHVVGGVDA